MIPRRAYREAFMQIPDIKCKLLALAKAGNRFRTWYPKHYRTRGYSCRVLVVRTYYGTKICFTVVRRWSRRKILYFRYWPGSEGVNTIRVHSLESKISTVIDELARGMGEAVRAAEQKRSDYIASLVDKLTP
jgi:hypothetical protein